MNRLLPLLLLVGCPTPKEETGDTAETDTDTDTDTDSDTDADTDTDTDVDTHALTDGFEALLDQSGGCSDSWVQAWNDAEYTGLEIYRPGILQAARDAGAAVDETLTIGVDDVTVLAEVANPVSVNYCTDALSKRDVYTHYDAVSGTVVLHIDPPASEYAPGILDVELTDVVLVDSYGNDVTVSTFTLTDVSVIANWGG